MGHYGIDSNQKVKDQVGSCTLNSKQLTGKTVRMTPRAELQAAA